MTPEDAKALRIAAATIRSANNPILADAFEDRRSYIERKRKRISALEIDEREKEQRLAIARDAYQSCREALATLASRSCRELLTARYIVEAVTASGHDLPALALELCDLLEKIGRPAWLDLIGTSEAAGWQESAAAIIAAARPRGKAATTAQISTSTPAAAPNTIQHLNTNKNEQELRRIFAALAEAGFIAGADAAGASMLRPFLDAFNPGARNQGRIIWTGTPLRGGAVGKPSPTQALDFAALMQGTERAAEQLRAERQGLPLIFEGLAFSGSTMSRFATSWNKGRGSEYHNELAAIIEGSK